MCPLPRFFFRFGVILIMALFVFYSYSTSDWHILASQFSICGVFLSSFWHACFSRHQIQQPVEVAWHRGQPELSVYSAITKWLTHLSWSFLICKMRELAVHLSYHFQLQKYKLCHGFSTRSKTQFILPKKQILSIRIKWLIKADPSENLRAMIMSASNLRFFFKYLKHG